MRGDSVRPLALPCETPIREHLPKLQLHRAAADRDGAPHGPPVVAMTQRPVSVRRQVVLMLLAGLSCAFQECPGKESRSRP